MNPFERDLERFDFAISKEQYPSKDDMEKYHKRLKRCLNRLYRMSDCGK